METAVIVNWCDDATMMSLARARGWTEDGAESILDLVYEDEAEETREFPTVAKAKAWARRNKARDCWQQPSVCVYQWPDRRRLSWERERVSYFRYVGDGCGWEEIT